jgi:putative endonuclease
MQYYIYILFSEIPDRYYIGSTSELEGRLKKHNHIHRGYTSAGKPWKLVYSESFNSKPEALTREKQLKKWKNREKTESLIKRYLAQLDQSIPTDKSGGS